MASPAVTLIWEPEPRKFREIIEVLRNAISPDSRVQENVLQKISQIRALPDAIQYFAAILCEPTLSTSERQLAGLTLKNIISENYSYLPEEAIHYVKSVILDGIESPDRAIQNTVGTVVTTIVCLYGADSWPEALQRLYQALESTDDVIFEGAISALSKVCEDEMRNLGVGGDQAFIQFCRDLLLPKLFAMCDSSFKLNRRRQSFSCIMLFVQANAFAPYSSFESFFPQYWLGLGNLAADEDPALRKLVVEGMVYVLEFRPEVIFNAAEAVFPFMMTCMGHSDYDIRQGAVEFWPALLRDNPRLQPMHKAKVLEKIREHLKRLVPILIVNLVYTDRDYASMDPSRFGENANVPDHAQDLQPRFHQHRDTISSDDDEEENDLTQRTWGIRWTARKGSALALDHLANTFPDEVLQVVMALVEKNIIDENWEVRESAVLTLGAIASGCIQGLWPFLSVVLQYLLKLCEDKMPLLRSISCWCISRFSPWICDASNYEKWLEPVLKQVLSCVLDSNKSVQEAACSAFCTLEEEARELLVLHLPIIVHTLSLALSLYQAKNLMLLYDAIGTLAESINGSFQKDNCGVRLVEPLIKKWINQSPRDPSIIAMFECLACCTSALKEQAAFFAPVIIEQCIMRIKKNISEGDQGNSQITECSLDLLSAVTNAMQERMLESLNVPNLNFIPLVDHCCQDSIPGVLQSSFALVGDLSRCCMEKLKPHLPSIISSLTKQILHDATSVSNNAGWALGEIATHLEAEEMLPYLDLIMMQFVKLLQRGGLHCSLLQNACISVGRLAMLCPRQVASHSSEFLKQWCCIMVLARNDTVKAHAFQGLGKLITEEPEAVLHCLPEFWSTILSFQPCPSFLQEQFQVIFDGLRQLYPEQWAIMWHSLSPHMKEQLTQRFGLTSGA